LRAHEPESYARVRRLLCPKDYVRLRLGAAPAMDVHEASGTLLLDLRARRWSSPLCAAASVDESWLPELFESPAVCGSVSAQAAAGAGGRAGSAIAAGGGDRGAGAVGLGIVQPGAVGVTVGSSGVVLAATAGPIVDGTGRLQSFCHAAPGRWHVMGVTQAA